MSNKQPFYKSLFMKPLNLQYFSEDNGEGSGEGGGEGEGAGTPPALTMDDVRKLIQSETDKIRTDYSQKLKGKEKEIDDLKKQNMTAEERASLALEEAEKKERELLVRENKLFAIDELQKPENTLPLSFLPFVTSESEEDTVEKIKTLKTVFDSAVAQAVEEKFKGAGRKHVKGSGGVGEITVEQFNQMGYKDRVELMNNDPELYNKLKNS